MLIVLTDTGEGLRIARARVEDALAELRSAWEAWDAEVKARSSSTPATCCEGGNSGNATPGTPNPAGERIYSTSLPF